jgi:predicted metalloendopeptidase
MYVQRLNNETWLDEETREKALEKAAKLGLHLGGSEVISCMSVRTRD